MTDRYRSSRGHRPGGEFDPTPRRQWSSWEDEDDWDDSADGDGDDWDEPLPRREPSRYAPGRSGARAPARGSSRGSAGSARSSWQARGPARDDEDDDWGRGASRSAARGREPYAAARAGAHGRPRAGAYRAPPRAPAPRSAPHAQRWTDTVERWGETSRQWVVSQAHRLFTSEQRAILPGAAGRGRASQASQKPARKTNRVVLLVVILFVLACPVLGGIQLGLVYAQARSGLGHFKNAQTDLSGLSAHPFDATAIAQMRAEFAGAYSDFSAASAGLQRVGILGITPVVGSKLGGAQRLLPIAAEAAQAGMLACDAFAVIAPKMKNPFDATGGGITADDLTAVSATFTQIKPIVDRVLTQVSALQPADLDLDPRLGPMVASVREKLPEIKQVMTDLQATLAIAGSLVGVGQPSTYLLEVLDSTELRPGGGFIGNYGFVTLSGGHLSGIKMQDVDLLDINAKYGSQYIPIPSNYSWFSIVSPRWGFRDSNLDADFPTAAKDGEQLYKQETGASATPVVGVIAITPWLIQNLLKITGPITMPEYNDDTISADNLVTKIHYYQLTSGVPPGSDKQYDPVSLSSLRKRFSGLLFQHFMETIKAQAAQDLGPLMKTIGDGLHSKDVQMYLDPAPAEDMLAQTHIGSTIEAPATGESLFVVDANIIANKANYVVTDALSDQVTIDAQGAAVHHTTLTYTWPKDPATLNETYPYYPSNANRLVQYQRIYVPPTATLDKRNGWYATDAGSAFNRQVWSGKMSVSYGTTTTLTLDWTDPKAVTHDASGWHYRYLLQRQAGAIYTLDLKVALPSCARLAATPSGFKEADAHTLTLAPEPFADDTNVTLDYAGC